MIAFLFIIVITVVCTKCQFISQKVFDDLICTFYRSTCININPICQKQINGFLTHAAGNYIGCIQTGYPSWIYTRLMFRWCQAM